VTSKSAPLNTSNNHCVAKWGIITHNWIYSFSTSLNLNSHIQQINTLNYYENWVGNTLIILLIAPFSKKIPNFCLFICSGTIATVKTPSYHEGYNLSHPDKFALHLQSSKQVFVEYPRPVKQIDLYGKCIPVHCPSHRRMLLLMSDDVLLVPSAPFYISLDRRWEKKQSGEILFHRPRTFPTTVTFASPKKLPSTIHTNAGINSKAR